MINTNITAFRKDVFKYVEQTIKLNQPVNVSTKIGNAVLLSESDYRSLMETLLIESVPGLKQSILEARDESLEDGLTFHTQDELDEWFYKP